MKTLTLCLVLPLLISATAAAQGLPPVPPTPPGNPITQDKANLGKALFWDEQLSSNRAVSCGTCHIPATGGSDPRTQAALAGTLHPGHDDTFLTPDDVRASPGLTLRLADGSFALDPLFRLEPQVTGRKTPTMINAAFASSLFWDGRANASFEDPVSGATVLQNLAALESQAVEPPVSSVEMGHVGRDWVSIAQELGGFDPLALAATVPAALASYINGRDYEALFDEAFGSAGVTPARIAMAIATYQRTLISNQAPFDAFLSGQTGALTPQEQQGRQIFNGIGRCNNCHSGPRLTDDSFRYIGVRPQFEDQGRFLVTGLPNDVGRMKVPSLRNVELRAPYFHNGGKSTLAEVVQFYNQGGDFPGFNKDANIQPLGLTPQQQAALVAFLSRPLTDPRVSAELPPFDRPTLYSESAFVPSSFGVASPGSGGVAPQLIALEPPQLGATNWTVGIDGALGGQVAGLVLTTGATAGLPFQGATSFVDISQAIGVLRIPSLGGSGIGDGWGSWTIDLPSNPALLGTTLYVQAFVLDPTGPGERLSATDARQLILF